MRLAPAALILALAGCGSDDPEPAVSRHTVVVEYRASTRPDEAVQAAHPSCVAEVMNTHMHPSWRSFSRDDMEPSEGRWTRTYRSVPAGGHSLRVDDPNACDRHPIGTVRDLRIYVNGVKLVTETTTPGTSGERPGFAFYLQSDGSVRQP